MSYRGPQPHRQTTQRRDIFQHGGETAIWQHYVSATTGYPVAGQGGTTYYAQHRITALFYGTPGFGQTIGERQQGIGMIAEGRFMVTTREKLGNQDVLVWRGTAYRVDGDSVPNHVAGTHSTIIKRGQ